MTEDVLFGLGGLAVIIVARLIARRTELPSSVLLVLIGIVYAELPGPNIILEPELILTVVIPPLLYSAALEASLIELRTHIRSVVSMSVVLVLVTAFAVGFAVSAVVPALPLGAAIALGAAVAPPDPVASLAVARRVGLPARLVTLVEGEGLLNDATALTLFTVAVATVTGHAAIGGGLGQFLLAAGGGLGVGAAFAWTISQVRRRLDDPLVDSALSLATPFLVFVTAEAVHASGVLAVVVAGLWLGHQAPTLLSGPSRLQARSVWRLVDFLLEGFVFLVIGEQLPTILENLAGYTPAKVIAAVGVTVAAVLLVRPAYLLIVERTPGLRRPTARLTGREILVLSWSGMRGVITLAAVFSLPLTVSGPSGTAPFPGRSLLLLCAYAVVVVTLVGQGLTFAPIVRRLGVLRDPHEDRRQRAEARLGATAAALARLDSLAGEVPIPEEIVEQLRRSAFLRRRRDQERLAEIDRVVDPATTEGPGGGDSRPAAPPRALSSWLRRR